MIKTILISSLILVTAAIFIGCGETSSTGGTQQSSGSGNFLVDIGSGFVPGGAGGYVVAGTKFAQAMNLNEKDEDQLGQTVAIQITNARHVSEDHSLSDYVALVGYTVSEASPRPDGNFVFGILDTDEVGAYSGPNGYIMITRGSLKHMRDEAELAGVLAHEIAHVCHEDGLNAVKNAKTNDALATAASTAANRSDNFGLLDASSDLLFRNIFTKGYDRDQELNADRSAVHYMAAAGYDPASYQRFIERISGEQHSGQGGLFSTHPGFDERKNVVAEEIARTGKGGIGGTNADRFMTETASIK